MPSNQLSQTAHCVECDAEVKAPPPTDVPVICPPCYDDLSALRLLALRDRTDPDVVPDLWICSRVADPIVAACSCGDSMEGWPEEAHEWAEEHMDMHDSLDTERINHRVTVEGES